jgi:EamA domain-containing membrane protein RarD
MILSPIYRQTKLDKAGMIRPRWAKRPKIFCAVLVTSNLWTYAWSIKCR